MTGRARSSPGGRRWAGSSARGSPSAAPAPRPTRPAPRRPRPWLAPPLVAAAACDGRRGVLVARGDLGALFAAHEGVRFVVDDVAAQLEAVAVAAPKLDIYRWVDDHLVEDGELLRRLYVLATAGHTDPGPG